MSTNIYPHLLRARPWRQECEPDQLGLGSGAKLHAQPSGLGTEQRKLPGRERGGKVTFPLKRGEGTTARLPCATAEECLPWSWEHPGMEMRRPSLFQPHLQLSRQMQSTYVLQGLHLQIPDIFPDYPANRSAALRAQGSGYKVKDTHVISPHFRPGWGLPLRKGGNEAVATLPSPSGTASSGYRKRTWRPRHPAKRLRCIQDFRSASLPPTAALKRPHGPVCTRPSGQAHSGHSQLYLAPSLCGAPGCSDLCLSPGLTKPVPWHFRDS